ncbi:MAG: phosphodiester glycosidase family protein [Planktomarina sp.]
MIWRISLLLIWLSTVAGAVDCADQVIKGKSYTLCKVDVTQTPPRLYLRDKAGQVYGEFSALPGPHALAMNAGMYHADRSPVGLYIEDGIQAAPLVQGKSYGNFGLVPNGVYCIGQGGAWVIETNAFAADPPACTYATQSGPMLVIDGTLHPRFIDGSTSLNVRNGVGTSEDGRHSYFVISNQPVNFFDFASVFRDELNLRQALYFDGRISRLYAPSLKRKDFGLPMGPIVAVPD